MCEKIPTWLRAALLSIVVLLFGIVVWSMRWEPVTLSDRDGAAVNCHTYGLEGYCARFDRWTGRVRWVKLSSPETQDGG